MPGRRWRLGISDRRPLRETKRLLSSFSARSERVGEEPAEPLVPVRWSRELDDVVELTSSPSMQRAPLAAIEQHGAEAKESHVEPRRL